jgi:hypothetical protein
MQNLSNLYDIFSGYEWWFEVFVKEELFLTFFTY